MPAHEYEVQIVDQEALTPWTAAQFASFIGTGNVLHDVLFPPASQPTPAELDTAAARHKASLKDDPQHNIFVQIVTADGDIMGGAKWQFWPHDPQRPATAPISSSGESTPEVKAEQAFAQKVLDEFLSRRARDMAMPHGLLDLCYTVPKYERKGVASALVSWGLERCDKEGWIAFTEASPRGWPVYERLGFERKEVVKLRYDELGEYAKNLDDVVWTFMVRPARKQK